MEENSNMTAERSLEIITEQIEKSRRVISKTTGHSLFIVGLSMIGIAIICTFVNLFVFPYVPLDTILWIVLPIIIWLVMRNNYKNRRHTPISLVGSLVGKTWSTFAIIVFVFSLVANIWNAMLSISATETLSFFGHSSVVASSFSEVDRNSFLYIIHRVPITYSIILLMGMTVAVTGHILKSKWLVWFGIIASLIIVFGFVVGFVHAFLAGFGLSIEKIGYVMSFFPYLHIMLFAIFGLMLPGIMLKKQNL